MALDEYILTRYFTLTVQDRAEVLHCRGDHNRLGFACQLCWLSRLNSGEQPEFTNPPIDLSLTNCEKQSSAPTAKRIAGCGN